MLSRLGRWRNPQPSRGGAVGRGEGPSKPRFHRVSRPSPKNFRLTLEAKSAPDRLLLGHSPHRRSERCASKSVFGATCGFLHPQLVVHPCDAHPARLAEGRAKGFGGVSRGERNACPRGFLPVRLQLLDLDKWSHWDYRSGAEGIFDPANHNRGRCYDGEDEVEQGIHLSI